jgi:hypothetical protein
VQLHRVSTISARLALTQNTEENVSEARDFHTFGALARLGVPGEVSKCGQIVGKKPDFVRQK